MAVAAMDADTLVDKFLQEKLQLNQKASSYTLLMLRATATKREIHITTQKVGLVLHPDKHFFRQLVQDNNWEVQQDVVHQAQKKLINFYKTFLKTKEELQNLDDGIYQQVVH
jgi:hypothetical protein